MKVYRDRLDELENNINLVSIELYSLDVLTWFKQRGWSLYKLPSDFDPSSYLELKPVVECGRVDDVLEIEGRYIPLPFHFDHKNWDVIRDLTFTLVSQGRGPYYVEFNEEGEPEGVFFIESIIYSPPTIELVIEPRLSKVKDTEKEWGTSVSIPLTELDRLKCLMKAMRIV